MRSFRKKTVNSHEVLKQSVSDLGVKSVASDLGLSTSLIYKWCQPSEAEDASGADNPLDRLAKVYELTGVRGRSNGYVSRLMVILCRM